MTTNLAPPLSKNKRAAGCSASEPFNSEFLTSFNSWLMGEVGLVVICGAAGRGFVSICRPLCPSVDSCYRPALAPLRPRFAPRSTPAGRDATFSGAFRPDVEGLRGLAVVPVLLYHAAVPGFAGGYVGVDVFLRPLGLPHHRAAVAGGADDGSHRLARFYARRGRRILPAAILVLVATLAASALVLPPIRVPDVAIDGVWTSLFSANIRFALQATDYLQSDLAPSPLLHYWSLGVEEQFYLVWPALLLLVVRRRRHHARAAGLLAIAVVVGSFALSLHLTATDAAWAFYSLPTRAWELALGALLAVAEMSGTGLPAGAAAAAGWIGFGLIGAAVASFSADTPFPAPPRCCRRLVRCSSSRPARIRRATRRDACCRPRCRASSGGSRTHCTSGAGRCWPFRRAPSMRRCRSARA
jgi:hypothetical protein